MKEQIRAVHSSQVRDYFSELGLSEALDSGRLHCVCCGTTITEENFGALTRYKGKLVFACDKSVCLLNLADMAWKKRECKHS